MLKLNSKDLDELVYSNEYMEYIMNHNSGGRIIYNGDSLLDAAESGYLFEQFLASIGYRDNQNDR